MVVFVKPLILKDRKSENVFCPVATKLHFNEQLLQL